LRTRTGIPVRHFDRIDSTNAEAHRMVAQGERGPLWIVAAEQTGGRGRLGRQWVSQPGNLYATRLFTLSAEPAVAAQLSFVAAVAVRQAVSGLFPELDMQIKWPNDLLIGGAKFCGLLPEVIAQPPTTIALGCGINIAHAPQGTPYPVTFLGSSASVESVFEELDSSLSTCLQIWNEGRGFVSIRERWSAHALGLNGSCTTEHGAGIFRGLAGDGALILELPDGNHKPIYSGEVRFAALEPLRRK
jgi:BirA family biotin operon repressor/biotin-[acetyl-CoA-carboxylase] ligase